MANYLKFFDTVEFKPIELAEIEKRKDNFNGTNNNPLIVKIAATHAGLITRNNGFYLPDRMRKGAASFITHYGKPIQTHHNDNTDPVGRVIGADYVDISAGVKDAFLEKIINSARGRYNDEFIKDFIVGKASFVQSVNFISDALSHKDSILDDPNYKGLGYILLTASISDPEAKQKILDGRYLTGSVGVSTNRAVCSICKQDWVTDGMPCEHKPGKVYDGAKAFMITGDLSYDEYSFVNVPADRHSGILEVNINGIKDSIVMDSSVGRTLSVDIITDNIDITDSKGTINNMSQGANMQNKLTELLLSLKTKFNLLDETEIESVAKSFDGTDLNSFDEIELANEAELKLDRLSLDKVFVLDVATKLEALKKVRPFMEEIGLTSVIGETHATADAFYDAVNVLEWQDYSELEDEGLIAYLVEHPEDAKLSGALRKRLPSSSFCGPNKSFPVPDKAHVTAARRLIGRASASSATKKKILACVNRKASAMGKDAVVAPVVPVVEPIVAEVIVPEVVETLDSVKALLTVELEKNTALAATNKELSDSLESRVKEIDQNILDKTALEKELNATREELKITHEDLVQMSDQLVTSQETATSLLVDKVITFKYLAGETIEDAVTLSTELTSLGEIAVKDQLNQLVSKVDMKKITDSINSGLARKPNGTVEDPSGNLEDQAKIYTKENVQAVAIRYNELLLGRGRDAAERFKREMQIQGIIPTG
jgi:hypothetical protein